MLSGILPTYQVERNWPADLMDIWGIEGVTERDSHFPGGHLALSLHNISSAFAREDQKELIVWRIAAELIETVIGLLDAVQTDPVHIFTPLPPYNPTLNLSSPGVFLPWFQPVSPGVIARFPLSGHMDAGSNPALDVKVVNGVPTTVVGPTLCNRGRFTGGSIAGGAQQGLMEFGLPGVDAPPFRLQPGQKLTCQSIASYSTGQDIQMRMIAFYSERPFVEGL